MSADSPAPTAPAPPSTAGDPAGTAAAVAAAPDGRRDQLRALIDSDTGRAAGLAAALMANSVIALLVTILFARLLGAAGYGSLGVLLSAFAVLMVPGSALQATVAREVSAEAAAESENPGAGVRRWLRHIAYGAVAVTLAAVLLRDLLAGITGVEDEWAAAAVITTGALWLFLCVQRGALQGLRRYRPVGWSIVGEAGARLAFGLGLIMLGMDVAGAFLGTGLGLAAMSLLLAVPLHRALVEADTTAGEGREPGFHELLARSWAPVLAFSLIALLQNVDIFYVKHTVPDDDAGAYVAATTAAKAAIWVSIGLGLYLLPEAVRRTHAGDDARPILARTLGLIAVVAVPMITLYALAAGPLLVTVFGKESYRAAADALPLLGVAMSLLACGYLSVQYLLALGRAHFLLVLVAGCLAEVGLLLAVGGGGLTAVAGAVVATQLALAPVVLAFVMRSAAAARRPLSAMAS